jgi:hypothetical protein
MDVSKIIIGIHGLGNKPPEKTLKVWWKASIREGLQNIGKPKTFFNFELIYWAHYLHQIPLNPAIKDKKNPLYINEPYVRARGRLGDKKPSELRKKILHRLEGGMERLFLNDDLSINYSSITDFIIHHFFSDFGTYYSSSCLRQDDQDCRAKDVICTRLADILKKNRRKKILLIAHSMGSIIAYDVLTEIVPSVPIDTFVTIGSPLGLPVIKSKIVADRKGINPKEFRLKTPENVLSHWYNLADLKDKIAVDYTLSDDFEENSRHVRAIDKMVNNDYEYEKNRNHHKSFGYLRTPEMAEIIFDFLKSGRDTPLTWIKKLLRINP